MIRLYFQRQGGALVLKVGDWYFSIFLNPKHWWIDWHKDVSCCKFWLLIGPFEINRVWSDNDVYPEEFL